MVALHEGGMAEMTSFNAHRKAVEIERDRLLDKLALLESTPGATFMECRTLQREIEQLEHQLIWYDKAPRSWFK